MDTMFNSWTAQKNCLKNPSLKTNPGLSNSTPTDPGWKFYRLSNGIPGSAEGLTCAGIVIDPDVARVADAHEGAGGVHTHGVLSAVVLPLSALVDV